MARKDVHTSKQRDVAAPPAHLSAWLIFIFTSHVSNYKKKKKVPLKIMQAGVQDRGRYCPNIFQYGWFDTQHPNQLKCQHACVPVGRWCNNPPITSCCPPLALQNSRCSTVQTQYRSFLHQSSYLFLFPVFLRLCHLLVFPPLLLCSVTPRLLSRPPRPSCFPFLFRLLV